MQLETLYKISYGMYVVCSNDGEKINGQIANSIMQITSEPPVVAVSINHQNLTHELISASKVFTASILVQETPLPFIGKFGFKSGRDNDKFAGVNYKKGELGAPVILDNTLGYFEANVIQSVDLGTHTVFFGKIVAAEIIKPAAEPMTYAYYHYVKRGTSPKSAPTYIKVENKFEEVK